MDMALRAMLFFLVVSALAQQTQAPNPSADWRTISEITIDRQGCFGSCPVYTLTLRRNGSSTYIGKRSVERSGQYTAKQIYLGDFNQLSKAISDIGFFGLQDSYGGSIDTEEIVVTVATPLQSKTVKTVN